MRKYIQCCFVCVMIVCLCLLSACGTQNAPSQTVGFQTTTGPDLTQGPTGTENTLEKGVFSVKMYGAEVDVEGAVIRELEFELSGQIITDESGHKSIRLEPIVLDDMTIRLDYEPEYWPALHDELSETGYYAVWISYLADLNRYATIQMGLSRSLDSCLLMVEDIHYFIGSTDPDFDPQTVFHQFDYINR